MNFKEVSVDIRDNVGVISLNAPDTLNALTKNMMIEIDQAVDLVSHQCRAMILTGAGRFFCSGASLDPARPLAEYEADRNKRDIGAALESTLNPLMLKLKNLDIPWISAVRGGAAGFGASLALAGDLIIATESAYFAQVFSLIGLIPDGGSTHLLVRSIGRARAMEMMLLGERLSAAKALEWGLINRAVEEDALMETAHHLAEKLAAGPAALKLIRQATWHAVDSSFENALNKERELQLLAGRTLDFEEGVNAFNEKRKTVFKGE